MILQDHRWSHRYTLASEDKKIAICGRVPYSRGVRYDGYETFGLYPKFPEQCIVVAGRPRPTKFQFMNSRFTFIVRFFSCVVAGFLICISSQPAQAGNPQTGRLVVQRSPTFGSRIYLQLWIDGSKVANIGPGQRYDESIPAGHRVLAVNYTPRTRHQPTSIRLTVRPGETYAFTAIRESDEGVILRQSNRIPP